MDRLDGVVLAGTEGASSPFFSSDGTAVAFFAGGQLKKMSLNDGVVQTLVPPRRSVVPGVAPGASDTILFTGPGSATG